MRNHPRAARGESAGYEGLRKPPVPLDAARLPGSRAGRAGGGRVGARRCAGRGPRLPQRPGQRDRAHRHDRPGDGLRHHRHRARLRPGQVQEAGRRRLFQDHQPSVPAALARLGYRPEEDARHRRPCRGPRHAAGRAGDQPRDARGHAGSARNSWSASRRGWPRPSTSASSSTAGRWARRSAATCWASEEARLSDPSFDLLAHLGFSKAEIEAANIHCLRHDDRRGGAGAEARASAGVRLRQSLRAHRAALPVGRGAHPHDGRGPALHLGRDLQDHQHAERGHGRGLPRGLRAVVEAGAEGQRALPGRLQAQPAALGQPCRG
ncbi:MAG: hypothetical protein KatS3mg118_2855 [Paracoccaceae bacterium]|nr:MAG: hypothetical protein KatS3mg118_2855 [Paracoccaceae bacterium]